MPVEVDKAITAFVRHRLIGVDNTSPNQLARKWGVAAATITNIRIGKQRVGAGVLGKIVREEYGGSYDRLAADALAFAEDRPELADETRGVFERAFGRLVLRNPSRAAAYKAAFEECVSDSFDRPEALDTLQAEQLIEGRAAARKGKRLGVREYED